MDGNYRPTNPFARRYRSGNPFATTAEPLALPEVSPPEPMGQDATVTDRTGRGRLADPARRLRQETSTVPPEREAEFRQWMARNGVTAEELNAPELRFDYRGAFLAGQERDPVGGHFPDTFKQHGHETFSDESRYATPDDPEAGSWDGETYILPVTRGGPPRVRQSLTPQDATAALVTPERRRPDIYLDIKPTVEEAREAERRRREAGIPYSQRQRREPLRRGGDTVLSPEQASDARMAALESGGYRAGEARVEPVSRGLMSALEIAAEGVMRGGGGASTIPGQVGAQLLAEGLAARRRGREAAEAERGTINRTVAGLSEFGAELAMGPGGVGRAVGRRLTAAGARRLLSRAAQLGTEFAGVEGGRAAATGDPAGAVAERAGEGFLMGSAFAPLEAIPAAYRAARALGERGAAIRMPDRAPGRPVEARPVPRRADVLASERAVREGPTGPELDAALTEGRRIRAAREAEPLPSGPLDVPAFVRAAASPEGGFAHPAVVSALGGAAGGAAAGAASGDTPEERKRNALLLAGAGLLGGTVAARRLMRRRPALPAGDAPVREALDAEVRRRLPDPTPRPGTPAAEINPDVHVNLARFALDPSGEAVLREEVRRVASTYGLAPKRRVTWDTTRQMAATLGLAPGDLGRHAGRIGGAEMLAMRNVISDNARALADILPRLEAAEGRAALTTLSAEARTLAEREVELLRMQAGSLQAQNDRLLTRFIKDRSQTGRDLNNLKILAASSLDPAAWLARARRLRGAPLLAEQEAEITRLAQAAVADPSQRVALARYVARLRTASNWEKAVTAWKAGLLTSPTTHLANLTGNVTMAVLESAKDAPAALFDRIMSVATGTRTVGGLRLRTVEASLRGARQGLREAADVIRGGAATEEALRRYDFTREVVYDSPLLNVYTQTVFRSLGAEDRIFRGAALQRSLAEQASVLAKQTGRSIDDVLRHPPDDLVLRAIGDAEVTTFQDRTMLADVLSKFQRAGGGAGNIIVPFARTPGNVGTRLIEYAGGGLVAGLVKLARAGGVKGLTPEIQRSIAQTAGRGTVGPLAIGMGYLLASQGRMTGAASGQRGERETQQFLGQQPNAIRIGTQWRDVRRISPLGNLMAYGATLYQIAHNPESVRDGSLVVQGLAALGRQVGEQSSLAGVQSAIQALGDPQAWQNYAERLASSVVPSIVRRTAQAADPLVRQTRGMEQGFRAAMPGASRSLAPKVDALGDVVARESGEPRAVAALLDFTSPRVDRSQADIIRREVSRTGATVTNLQRRPGESDQDYAQRAQRVGRQVKARLLDTIRSADYTSASLEERRELLEAAIRSARATASRAYRQSNPWAQVGR